MIEQEHVAMEQMELFRCYVEIADWAWKIVSQWKPLAMDTVGKQLVRAADSIGANLVEGDGRYASGDALHFFVIARASARETRYWLQRAIVRNLISAEEGQRQIDALSSATRMLNRLIDYRRQHKRNEKVREQIREEPEAYYAITEDPFTDI